MINKNPKVSIIMPVYNAEKFLDEAINSLLNQSLEDFELIIIDDQSTDHSLSIIRKYKKKDKRIVFLRNKQNLGCVNTRNKGLKIAKGKYIAVMDSDDVSLKDRLEKQVKYLDKHPDIYLIGGSAIVIDEQDTRLGVFLKQDNPIRIGKKLRDFNCIIHPSVMYRNTGEFFYREKFIISDDYDFLLRVLSSNRKISNLNEFLVKYRLNQGSFTFTKKNPEYFFKKAKEFYQQRVRYGSDDYSKMNPDKVIPLKLNASKLNSKIIIFAKFQDNQMKEVRKRIKEYAKKYDLEKNLVFYYLFSFFPLKFLRIFKK